MFEQTNLTSDHSHDGDHQTHNDDNSQTENNVEAAVIRRSCRQVKKTYMDGQLFNCTGIF